ncbi:DUF1569 domain-containing protein [Arenimonas terrae]|uniref:DUF1569 domain-containing protein n=1 Tax=Arenimonas terrae TaxID=2546226 RepID=A0A5C4RR09_9GAMM|nr:DUF1569 domain-containing protein [Arenimonas terrae]TNJ33723.1 DUF1569 domain-containing protein [Arenimonas terrae]
MQRRRFLTFSAWSAATLAVAGGGGALWLSGQPAPIVGFDSMAQAREWLQALATNPAARSLTDWPLAQVLEHCAQSVEFSLDGFPQPKPALFQDTAGALAFAAFNRRGAMRHGLTEAIPGAPPLAATDLAAAAARLHAAFDRFEAHDAPLQPHFAYGELDKTRYTRAHLLHLANHAQRIALA